MNNFKSFRGKHRVGPFTNFTSIIGPNGSGKSNIVDALCFALCLPMVPAKYSHVRELVYRSLNQEEVVGDDNETMAVQLNFMRGDEKLSIKRSFHAATNACEYSVISYGSAAQIQPKTSEEYKEILEQLNLRYPIFCVLQDRLFGSLLHKDNLSKCLEQLSGSIEYKEEFNSLKEQKLVAENGMRDLSEQLKISRQEKIKLRGLSDYQKQIEKCVDDQKETENQLDLLSLLITRLHMSQMESEQEQLTNSIDSTYDLRKKAIEEIKRDEGASLRAKNQIEEKTSSVRKLHSELLELKTNAFQADKQIEVSKDILREKRSLLVQQQHEQAKCQTKIQQLNEQSNEIEANLKEQNKMIKNSPDLEQEMEHRESYLNIKSQLQTENSKIEREMSKLESQIQQLSHRKQTAQADIRRLESHLALSSDSLNLQNKVESTQMQIQEKKQRLQNMQKQAADLKEKEIQHREEINSVEKQLFEKEFELQEIESEKNIKADDAKMLHSLKELSSRCQGFMGQFYELIHPIDAKYDLAVKVALSRYLNLMVVDTEESANICREFLVEKQLRREVLVLANIPERQLPKGINNQLQGSKGAILLYDAVEVGRQKPLLEKAMRYFAGEKVIAKNFEQAVYLQKNKGVTNIVTEDDGTEFKPGGLISGGQHTGLNSLKLGGSFIGQKNQIAGTHGLDKQIVKLVDATQKLESKHAQLKRALSEDYHQRECQLRKEIQSIDLDLELQHQELKNTQNAIQQSKASSQGHIEHLNQAKSLEAELQQKIQSLTEEQAELQGEIQTLERDQFKAFCKQVKVKNVQEFEQRLGKNGDLLNQKSTIEKQLESNKDEINFLNKNLNLFSSNTQAFEKAIQSEEDKIGSLRGVDGNKQAKMELLQKKLIESEQEIQGLEKQKASLQIKQVKQKQELDLLSNRDESLQKQKTTSRIHLKRFQFQVEELIDSAKLNNLVKDFSILETESKLSKELIDRSVDLKMDNDKLDVQACEDLEKEMKKKLRDLEMMEEKFNICVAVIPETDENSIKLSEEIQKLKDNLDAASKVLAKSREELNSIAAKRKETFMNFFNSVAKELPSIYKTLTTIDNQLGGSASLLLQDNQDTPFDSQILFDFCPPKKRFGADLEQLSGGEKTIAALSFIFALVQVKRPPILMFDEVDAFLDSDNVEAVKTYIKQLSSTDQLSQTLVVSHKPELSQNADSLVGVSLIKEQASSKAFSLDLREYD